MRQSLAQLEQQFVREAEQDQRRRVHLQRNIDARARKRLAERKRKKGSMRFYVLVITLIATALIVAGAMYWTLYELLS
jgi:hypothetical protein